MSADDTSPTLDLEPLAAGSPLPGGPTLTLAAAALAADVSDATIRRRLKAGTLHGTRLPDGSWSIPLRSLIDAGLAPRTTGVVTPAAPTVVPPPAPPEPPVLPPVTPLTPPVALDAWAQMTAELASARAELAAAQARAAAADQLATRLAVAEAIAAERADALVDLRRALDLAHRQLAGPIVTGPLAPPPPSPGATDVATAPAPRRRWFRRGS